MSTTPRTRTDVAARIDAAVLAPGATDADVRHTCAAALLHGVRGVMVRLDHVAVVTAEVAGSGLDVVAAVGLDAPADAETVDATLLDEVAAAGGAGAYEVDVPVPAAVFDADDDIARRVIARAVTTAHDTDLAIACTLDTAELRGPQLRRAVAICVAAGADRIGTASGAATGRPSVADVAAVATAAGDRAQVGATGVVSDWDELVAFLDAGADVVATPTFVTVLDDAPR
ncbi:MAG: hypothetical protein KY462_15475 [Actinobacteria bacterium]|nr:hypothetical protein [Actinomycetota bacterium]